MTSATVRVLVDEPLRIFLPVRHRSGDVVVDHDGTSSLGHVVQSVGVPLTEVGRMTVGGVDQAPSYRPRAGDVVEVAAVARPQPLPVAGARFVLDVHLGSLARRMRLLGIDTRYASSAHDDELLATALAEDRVLLSKDRGLLRRRVLRHAAYVRGVTADEQLADVLDRFAPSIEPFTRCTACNGPLHSVPKADVIDQLEPGTARSYDEFVQCADCGRAYWSGAHSRRLRDVVESARRSRAE